MGINLKPLLESRKLDLEVASGKIVAIDAYNTLYQFLTSIRKQDGTPLTDQEGRMVGHLSGALQRNGNLLAAGIKPVYVFDGKPSPLKHAVLKERSERKKQAQVEYEKAVEEGDIEKARTKAMQTVRLTPDIIDETKAMLDLMGIPVVQAPSEGEAQASHMAAAGDVWAVGSQDFDTLLFGSPVLVRNLGTSGRRKLPGRREYVAVEPEIIELEETLAKLEVTREQLVDMAVMIGTDYNPGIHGIGPKKAYKLISEHGTLEAVIEEKEFDIPDMDEVRKLFLEPAVTSEYDLNWQGVNEREVRHLLCDEHDFNPDRVDPVLKKIKAAERAPKGKQSSLGAWG